jgi:uncharacterized membrane protein
MTATMQRRHTDPISREDWGDGRERKASDPIAMAMGLFSVGLGLAQLAAPRKMVNAIGVEDTDRNRDTMIALGLRELTSGVGILGPGNTAGWLQARVGGDIMDLALLAGAFRSDDQNRRRLNMAIAAVAGALVLDVMAARRARDGSNQDGNGRPSGSELYGDADTAVTQAGPGHVAQSVTIRQPVEMVYAFWRNFENLPRFMDHLESVRVTGDRQSHWVAKAPAGQTVEWDAETVEDRTDELIAWRSLPGASVPNSGQVRFQQAAGDRGTEVHVELRYDPPGGKLGALVAKLFGEEPSQQVAGDLRRLKQVLETGEVLHSDASIHRGMHPAQPPEEMPRPDVGGDETLLTQQSQEAAATATSNRERESTTARPRAAAARGRSA